MIVIPFFDFLWCIDQRCFLEEGAMHAFPLIFMAENKITYTWKHLFRGTVEGNFPYLHLYGNIIYK